MASDLEQRNCASDRRIQRLQAPTKRYRRDHIAAFTSKPGQSVAFSTNHQNQRLIREVNLLVDGGIAPGIKANHPGAAFFGTQQERWKTTHKGDWKVLDGASCSLCDCWGDVDSTVLGHDHTSHTSALRAAKQRTEVAGIGQPVQGQDERLRATQRAHFQQVVRVDVVKFVAHGDDTLWGFSAGVGEHHFLRHPANGDAGVGCQLFNLAQDRTVVCTLRHHQRANASPPNGEKLSDSHTTLDLRPVEPVWPSQGTNGVTRAAGSARETVGAGRRTWSIATTRWA